MVQNAWAFFPLFPLLARGVMTAHGCAVGSWPRRCWRSSSARVAAVLVHAAVRVGAPRAVAARPGLPLATVALVTSAPASPVLRGRVHRVPRPGAGRGGAGAAAAAPLRVGGGRGPRARHDAGRRAARWPSSSRCTRSCGGARPAGAASGSGRGTSPASPCWPAPRARRASPGPSAVRSGHRRAGRLPAHPGGVARAAARSSRCCRWVDVARWLADGAWPLVLVGAALAAAVVLLSPPARRLGAGAVGVDRGVRGLPGGGRRAGHQPRPVRPAGVPARRPSSSGAVTRSARGPARLARRPCWSSRCSGRSRGPGGCGG